MGHRNAWKTSFKSVIGKFTNEAQINAPEENLTKALVLAKSVQDESRQAEDTLPQRWQDLFAEDETKAKIPSHPGNEAIDERARRVTQAWRRFYKSLPKEQSADLEDSPPNLQFLRDAVDAANANLEKKQKDSPISRVFHSICGTFNDYQNLAKVLPSGDKYVCLITGSLGALIKASVNHTEVAEGISRALADISEDISFWGQLIAQHHTNEKMQSYIKDLCVLLFDCFADIFAKWHSSMWTRIKYSFDGNALKKIVTRYRDEMSKISYWLQREAALDTNKETRHMSQVVTEMLDGFNNFGRHMSRFVLLPNPNVQQPALLVTGNSMQRTLEENFVRRAIDQTWLYGDAEVVPREMLRVMHIDGDFAPTAQAIKHSYTKEDLQDAIARVCLSLPEARPTMPVVSAADLSIDPFVFQALQEWNASITSTCLWIEGPDDVDKPSQNTMTSASMVGIAQRSNSPYLAYFVHPCRATGSEERTRKGGEMLLALIHTLISQLVNHFPGSSFESDADLSAPRFHECLTGTPEESTILAILLLRDLLQDFPSPLLCFVDGLQYFPREQKVTARFQKLVEVLCDGTPLSSPDRVRKVCFTTDGYVPALAGNNLKKKLSRVTYESESEDDDRTVKDL